MDTDGRKGEEKTERLAVRGEKQEAVGPRGEGPESSSLPGESCLLWRISNRLGEVRLEGETGKGGAERGGGGGAR